MFTISIAFPAKPASSWWMIPLAITRSSSQKCALSTLIRGGEVFSRMQQSCNFDLSAFSDVVECKPAMAGLVACRIWNEFRDNLFRQIVLCPLSLLRNVPAVMVDLLPWIFVCEYSFEFNYLWKRRLWGKKIVSLYSCLWMGDVFAVLLAGSLLSRISTFGFANAGRALVLPKTQLVRWVPRLYVYCSCEWLANRD
jgi:hypothetical protein